MTNWQKRARLVIAISALAFAGVVALTLKKRDTQPSGTSPARTDPSAVVEVTGGRVERFRLSREDVRVAYERQLTYADGGTRLIGVTITADARAGERTFTVTGKEGTVGQGESVLQLNGDVQLTASDGLVVRTDHASYSSGDAFVRAPGPVEFSRGRLTGSGLGMTYDTVRDMLVISDQSRVHVTPDNSGSGLIEIASGSATFSRRAPEGPEGEGGEAGGGQNNIRFERDVRLDRDGQHMEADNAVAYLTPDEKQIRLMELRGRSRIAIAMAAAGHLQELAGRDIDLTYADDGQSIERAVLTGGSAIMLAGAASGPGRHIAANSITVALAPDGATPTAMTARESVVLTLPAERTVPARTIEADEMESFGEAPRGLTEARFTGNVEYREQGAEVDREVTASILDVALEPGMAGFREAKFSRRVHFVDGEMTSDAAEGRYDLTRGVLELSGSEPGILRPRVINRRLTIDATRVDVTMAGPQLKATGDVKSVVNPPQKGRATETRLPSMFKQDRPVNVTADVLDYDSKARKATYTGNAQLWQDDTSLKGAEIVLDDVTGDLTAGGEVTTVSMRNSVRADRKPERIRSIATSSSFRYEEKERRATYTGKAHMNSTDGDITADRLEIYLKPAEGASGPGGSGGATGDDIERAEAFDNVTLKDRNRTTTGNHLVYMTADERYVITGTPVKVVDECRRETIGRTLTYLKSAETITIDGNQQTRTQTKGSSQCP